MKKCFAIILTVLMLCGMPLTAYATEVEGKAASAFKCNVVFYITDETGGYPGSGFTANMTDETPRSLRAWDLYAAPRRNSKE